MTELTLYTREGCHLCERAAELVEQVAPTVRLVEVDIEGDPELEARYGLRIPVLKRRGRGAELGWPFSPQDLEALLD
jgi:glutaredoxin